LVWCEMSVCVGFVSAKKRKWSGPCRWIVGGRSIEMGAAAEYAA
jgi:hypothetical protein